MSGEQWCVPIRSVDSAPMSSAEHSNPYPATRVLSITPSAPFSKRTTTTAVSTSAPPARRVAKASTDETSPTSQRALSMSWTVMSTKRLPRLSVAPPCGWPRLR